MLGKVVYKAAVLAAYFYGSRWAFRTFAATFPDATRQDFIMWGTFAVHSVRSNTTKRREHAYSDAGVVAPSKGVTHTCSSV